MGGGSDRGARIFSAKTVVRTLLKAKKDQSKANMDNFFFEILLFQPKNDQIQVNNSLSNFGNGTI